MKIFTVLILLPTLALSKSKPIVCWESIGPDGPEDVCYKGAWMNTI